MSKWMTIAAAAEKLEPVMGKGVSVDDVFELAFNGVLKVCASIPGHKDAGRGELTFYAEDGSPLGSATNGFYQGLTRRDFQALQAHGRLYLDGRPGELPNEGGEPIRVILGPESPVIGVSDLRISERELQRFIASVPSAEAQDDDVSRTAGWRRVMLENMQAIIKTYRDLGGRGSFARCAVRWVKKNGPRDTIPSSQPDGDSFEWLDQDGDLHPVKLKTIQNALGEWRKEGVIPGDLK